MILMALAMTAGACGSVAEPPEQGNGGTGGTTSSSGGSHQGGAAGQVDAGAPDAPDATCESGGALSAPLMTDATAVFITSDTLAPAFEPYAHLHTLLGIPSSVVTTDQICAGQCDDADPRADTAAHIKQWIMSQPALRYVILAGDIEHVPARQVHDRYQNPILIGYSFEDDFQTDYYYADFSNWDGNGDGIYAEDGIDQPDYRPEIAVSRISSSTPEEAELYLGKVLRYLTDYEPAHAAKTLLLSNVATQFAGVDIDGAWYFEAEGKTLSLLPPGSEVRRLYATAMAGAEQNSVAAQIAAIEEGQNLVVHSGHGGVKYLTDNLSTGGSMTGEMAYELTNSTYPIFLSSACEAGTFAADDSAGEMLMNAPHGGAIAYLGNSVTGLGLAGGMQIIDELLRFVQANPYPMLGDALLYAHDNMPEHDVFRVPVGNFDVPVVDPASYEWTQKSATMFGDILIPVWTGPPGEKVSISANRQDTCEGAMIELTVSPAVEGMARVHAGASYYEVSVAEGRATLHLDHQPDSIGVGMAPAGRLATMTNIEF